MAKKNIWPEMQTNYSIAFIKYENSGEYKSLIKSMAKKGIVQPYSGNIVRRAFDAGWGDKEVIVIK